ncbi:MAG: protease modulator HflC [Lentisphaerae bacterium]|nr:protease modulator HflC [Lentisphaerota bacterium]
MANGNFFKHWPTMLLGLIVALILLTAVFSFQLNQTEVAVVTTFGRPEVVEEPGLHFRWPYPFQKVYRFDKRIRCYEGSSGRLEETVTKDGHNIIVGIYVNYRISDVALFFSKLQDIAGAEEVLNTLMRSAKNAAFGKRDFRQIIVYAGQETEQGIRDAAAGEGGTDGNAPQSETTDLNEIAADIKATLVADTRDFGIEIIDVGISSLGVPETVTEKVFERMIAERRRFVEQNLARGRSEAEKIRVEANLNRDKQIAEAQAEALRLRAEGDAAAAQFYREFAKDPELAEFLRKIEALRLMLRERTTLILDPSMPPFDILSPGTVIPGRGAAPAAGDAPAADAPAETPAPAAAN